MAKLKKYNIDGKETGSVDVADALANAQANGQMIKDYIVALRANARQWSANTKTRSQVKHTTKKPHPQKGTGRARQGSLVGPHQRGGGRAFGPKPKFDQHISLNVKEKRAVIRHLIGEKIRDNKLHVIESTQLDRPQTKAVATLVKNTGASGRVLFLGEGNYHLAPSPDKPAQSAPVDQHNAFIQSARNLQKTEFRLAKNVSGYDVLCAADMYVTEAALKELEEWLCKAERSH